MKAVLECAAAAALWILATAWLTSCASPVGSQSAIRTPPSAISLDPNQALRAQIHTTAIPPRAKITLAWDSNANDTATGYILQWIQLDLTNDCLTNAWCQTNLPLLSTITLTNLTKGLYYFALVATNTVGISDPATLNNIPVPYPWPREIVVFAGTNILWRGDYPQAGVRFWTNGSLRIMTRTKAQ